MKRSWLLALLLSVGAVAVARPPRAQRNSGVQVLRGRGQGFAQVAAPTPPPLPAPDAGPPPPAITPSQEEAHASPAEVKLGTPFNYEVTLTHPAAQRYELQTLPPDGPFELVSQTRDRQDHGADATTVFHVQLALFELGAKPLPPLTFEVTQAGQRSLYTLPSRGSVTGLSSLPDDADKKGASLNDIKPPEPVWVRSFRLLGYVALAIAAAGLLYFLVRWLRRRAQRPAALPPPLPLDARTLLALSDLGAQGLPAQGRIREFHFQLSEILRGYLGERFTVDALECTSAELLQRLQRVHAVGLPLTDLARFLQESDFIKYARADATPASCDAALRFAQELVQKTRPPPSNPSGNVPGNQLPAA